MIMVLYETKVKRSLPLKTENFSLLFQQYTRKSVINDLNTSFVNVLMKLDYCFSTKRRKQFISFLMTAQDKWNVSNRSVLIGRNSGSSPRWVIPEFLSSHHTLCFFIVHSCGSAVIASHFLKDVFHFFLISFSLILFIFLLSR